LARLGCGGAAAFFGNTSGTRRASRETFAEALCVLDEAARSSGGALAIQ